MSSFIARNLTEIEAVAGCTFACICNTVFHMFSCLQNNCQPFHLLQLLKFHPFDWLLKFIFKPRATVLTTKWYRSNQCLVFPLCFLGTKDSADYHKEMNSIHFERWWEDSVLLRLPTKLVVVIDNVRYHSRQTEESRAPPQTGEKHKFKIGYEKRRRLSKKRHNPYSPTEVQANQS